MAPLQKLAFHDNTVSLEHLVAQFYAKWNLHRLCEGSGHQRVFTIWTHRDYGKCPRWKIWSEYQCAFSLCAKKRL